MFVHGEQADTILASLLALMASLQSLSPCQIVTCPACFVIIAKPQKIPFSLLCPPPLTQHIRDQSRENNGTGSGTESCREKWYGGDTCSLEAAILMHINLHQPPLPSPASPHICFAEPWMSSCTREDGSGMRALWLAGRPWCVWGKVPLVGSLGTAVLGKSGPLPPFPLSLL